MVQARKLEIQGLLSNGKIEVGESVFVVPWYCCPVCIIISIISISEETGQQYQEPRVPVGCIL